MANTQIKRCLTTLVIRDTNENKSFFTQQNSKVLKDDSSVLTKTQEKRALLKY